MVHTITVKYSFVGNAVWIPVCVFCPLWPKKARVTSNRSTVFAASAREYTGLYQKKLKNRCYVNRTRRVVAAKYPVCSQNPRTGLTQWLGYRDSRALYLSVLTFNFFPYYDGDYITTAGPVHRKYDDVLRIVLAIMTFTRLFELSCERRTSYSTLKKKNLFD